MGKTNAMQQPIGAAARRRLSARQTLQRLIVRSIDIEQRLCVPPQWQKPEGKERAELKLVGKGSYASVYSLGTAIAVKRILKPAIWKYLDPAMLEQSPFLLQAYQRMINEYRQPLVTTEEFVAVLAGQYGIAPYVYRVEVCPATGYHLLFMEQWDRTFETDLSAARCAEDNITPLLPWLKQPLRIWRDLSMKVMELNSFGILHNDIHHGNVVVRRDPLSGQPQIALIDFGFAHMGLQNTQRQRLHDYSVIYEEMFAEWNRLGWLDVPLTNTDIMQRAVKQFTEPILYDDSSDLYQIQKMLQNWWYGWHTVTDIIACAAEAHALLTILPAVALPVALPLALPVAEAVGEGRADRPKRRHSSPTT